MNLQYLYISLDCIVSIDLTPANRTGKGTR